MQIYEEQQLNAESDYEEEDPEQYLNPQVNDTAASGAFDANGEPVFDQQQNQQGDWVDQVRGTLGLKDEESILFADNKEQYVSGLDDIDLFPGAESDEEEVGEADALDVPDNRRATMFDTPMNGSPRAAEEDALAMFTASAVKEAPQASLFKQNREDFVEEEGQEAAPSNETKAARRASQLLQGEEEWDRGQSLFVDDEEEEEADGADQGGLFGLPHTQNASTESAEEVQREVTAKLAQQAQADADAARKAQKQEQDARAAARKASQHKKAQAMKAAAAQQRQEEEAALQRQQQEEEKQPKPELKQMPKNKANPAAQKRRASQKHNFSANPQAEPQSAPEQDASVSTPVDHQDVLRPGAMGAGNELMAKLKARRSSADQTSAVAAAAPAPVSKQSDSHATPRQVGRKASNVLAPAPTPVKPAATKAEAAVSPELAKILSRRKTLADEDAPTPQKQKQKRSSICSQCPACSKTYNVAASNLGKKVRCKECKGAYTITEMKQ